MKQKRYVLDGIIRVNVARTVKSLWEVNRTWESLVVSEVELPKVSPASEPPSLHVSLELRFQCQEEEPRDLHFLFFLMFYKICF